MDLRWVSTWLIMAVLGACASPKEWRFPPASADEETAIYIVSHGWHAGIVITRENLGAELGFFVEFLGDSPYYEVGWGDKAFYQSEKPGSGLAAKAIIWPTDSVMHIIALPENPQNHFPQSEVIEIRLSKTAHGLLNRAIAASFVRDENGHTMTPSRGRYSYSRFFDAEGKYYATNTCNTWAARMLREAGMPMRVFMTLTAGSVMRQTEKAVRNRNCCISPD